VKKLSVCSLLFFCGAANAAPRVMSADYCADQYVLALADEADIAALSRDATRDFSYLRAKAAGLPRARPDPEEAARIAPDIILRFWGGNARAFERLGVKVATLGYAADFDAVKSNIEIAARTLGHEDRGAALIHEMDRRISLLKAAGAHGVSAAYATPGGVTAGRGTFVDAIFGAAGVRNAFGEKAGWSSLPLEKVLADPPQLLITGFFASSAERHGNWAAVRHPAFQKLFARTPTVALSADVLSCPGWFALDAAEAISRAAERIRE
jgi:iron complex transport system substrate-binding protein